MSGLDNLQRSASTSFCTLSSFFLETVVNLVKKVLYKDDKPDNDNGKSDRGIFSFPSLCHFLAVMSNRLFSVDFYLFHLSL